MEYVLGWVEIYRQQGKDITPLMIEINKYRRRNHLNKDFEDDFVDDGKTYRSSNGFFSTSSITLMLIIFSIIYFVFFTGSNKRRY